MIHPLLRRSLSLVLLSASMALGACAAPEDATTQDDSDVVGGRAEKGFAAVGFLAKGTSTSTLSGPNCGATLIAPDLAITAAHCIEYDTAAAYGFGMGDKADGKIIPAIAVYNHPAYNKTASPGQPRYLHDLALLKLATPVPGAVIAPIADAKAGQMLTYVGYGRVTEGDVNNYDGYTGERKSADFDVTHVDDLSVFVAGKDGGNCWGDSGGPLLEPQSGAVTGVLADFDGEFNCRVGNKMIFTRLAGERAFLDAAKKCVSDRGFIGKLPASCPMTGGEPQNQGGVLEAFATGAQVPEGTIAAGWSGWHDNDQGWGKNWRLSVTNGAQEIGVRPGSFGIEKTFGAAVQGKTLRITHSFECANSPCWYEVLSERRIIAKFEASFAERTDEVTFDADEKVVRFKVGSTSADRETRARILEIAVK